MKNKKLITLLAGIALLVVIAAVFFPALAGFTAGAVGVTKAIGFITAGYDYHGKENMEINLRPRFMGKKPQEMGIRIIDTMGSDTYKLTIWGGLKNILMPYVSGFQGGRLPSRYQKELTLAEFKAEASYDKHNYANMVQEQIVNANPGIKQNDISGTIVWDAEQKLFFDAVEGDVFKQFWLGDTTKTHINAGYYPGETPVAYAAGGADKYYNGVNGLLKNLMDDVYQSYVSHQVRISGWNKTTYPTLYLVESGGSVYAYPTSAKRTGAVSTDRLFSFPPTNATYPFEATVTELNSSGFGGKIVLEKACTSGTFELLHDAENYITKLSLPASLTTDTADTYFGRMLAICTPEMKELKDKGMLVFHVTDAVYYNYKATLRSIYADSKPDVLVDGVPRYAYDGVPIIPMHIDSAIEEDFASTFPRNIIILGTPGNYGLLINGSSNFSETRYWFNPDMNENRQRTQFKFGADYVLPELVTMAY